MSDLGPRAAETHELKTWTEFFDLVGSGDKTCEVRIDDRDYQVGDDLLLRDYDPKALKYLGRELRVRVTHVLRAPFMPMGLAAISFRKVKSANECPHSHVDGFVAEGGGHVLWCEECGAIRDGASEWRLPRP